MRIYVALIETTVLYHTVPVTLPGTVPTSSCFIINNTANWITFFHSSIPAWYSTNYALPGIRHHVSLSIILRMHGRTFFRSSMLPVTLLTSSCFIINNNANWGTFDSSILPLTLRVPTFSGLIINNQCLQIGEHSTLSVQSLSMSSTYSTAGNRMSVDKVFLLVMSNLEINFWL
jgi:hypothetical protein